MWILVYQIFLQRHIIVGFRLSISFFRQIQVQTDLPENDSPLLSQLLSHISESKQHSGEVLLSKAVDSFQLGKILFHLEKKFFIERLSLSRYRPNPIEAFLID